MPSCGSAAFDVFGVGKLIDVILEGNQARKTYRVVNWVRKGNQTVVEIAPLPRAGEEIKRTGSLEEIVDNT